MFFIEFLSETWERFWFIYNRYRESTVLSENKNSKNPPFVGWILSLKVERFFISFHFLFFFNYRIWIITCPNTFSLWNRGPVKHPIIRGSIRTNPLIELQSLPITRRRWMMIVMMCAPGPPWLIITNHQSKPPLWVREGPPEGAQTSVFCLDVQTCRLPLLGHACTPQKYIHLQRDQNIKTKKQKISFFT